MDKWAEKVRRQWSLPRPRQRAGLEPWWGEQSQATDRTMLAKSDFAVLASGQLLSRPALHCGYPHFLLLPFIDCELLGGEEVYLLCLSTSYRRVHARHREGSWLRKLCGRMNRSPCVGGIYWSRPSPSTSLVFVTKAETQAESNEVDI